MAKRKKKSQVEPFLLLPRRTIRSEELNKLSVHARWLYVVLLTEWHRGEQQEQAFVLPYTQLQEITRYRPERIAACLSELEEAGFLQIKHGALEYNPNYYKPELGWLVLKSNDVSGWPDGEC